MFLKGEILIQYIPFSVGADKLMSISYKYNSINLDDYLEMRNHVNKTPVTREIADEIMKNCRGWCCYMLYSGFNGSSGMQI